MIWAHKKNIVFLTTKRLGPRQHFINLDLYKKMAQFKWTGPKEFRKKKSKRKVKQQNKSDKVKRGKSSGKEESRNFCKFDSSSITEISNITKLLHVQFTTDYQNLDIAKLLQVRSTADHIVIPMYTTIFYEIFSLKFGLVSDSNWSMKKFIKIFSKKYIFYLICYLLS